MQSLRLFHFSPGLQCYWSGNIHAGNSKDSQLWTVLSELPSISCTQASIPSWNDSIIYYNHLAMALLFQPFISMLRPRAHELARMNEPKMKE
jgi:hypothetical protein